MREELAQLYEQTVQTGQIRKVCESQRRDLEVQQAFLKVQQEKLQREAERLRELKLHPPKSP